jgi:hypothetical protein
MSIDAGREQSAREGSDESVCERTLLRLAVVVRGRGGDVTSRHDDSASPLPVPADYPDSHFIR